MASHKKRRLAHGQLDQQGGGVEDRRAAVEDNDREQREKKSPVHVPPNNNTGRVAGVALLVFGAVACAANLGLRSHETVAEGEHIWRSIVRWDSRGVHARKAQLGDGRPRGSASKGACDGQCRSSVRREPPLAREAVTAAA